MIIKLYTVECQREYKPPVITKISAIDQVDSIFSVQDPARHYDMTVADSRGSDTAIINRRISIVSEDNSPPITCVRDAIFACARSDCTIESVSFRPVDPTKQQMIFQKHEIGPHSDGEAIREFLNAKRIVGFIKPYSAFNSADLTSDETLSNPEILLSVGDVSTENKTIQRMAQLFLQEPNSNQMAIRTVFETTFNYSKFM